MNIGDRVRIKHSDKRGYSEVINKCGTIIKINGNNCRNCGVLIDNCRNEHSSVGCYWFKKGEFTAINEKDNIMKTKDYKLIDLYAIASVIFVESNNQNIKYEYLLFDKDISVGDKVLVKTAHHGMSVAKVTDISTDSDYIKRHIESERYITDREIICAVNMHNYYKRIDKRDKLMKLEKEINKKISEVQSLALYDILSKINPELEDMINMYKELLN